MAIFAACDVDPKHKATLYAVAVEAREVGAGHKSRKVTRKLVGHLCEKCLPAHLVSLRTLQFVPGRG